MSDSTGTDSQQPPDEEEQERPLRFPNLHANRALLRGIRGDKRRRD